MINQRCEEVLWMGLTDTELGLVAMILFCLLLLSIGGAANLKRA